VCGITGIFRQHAESNSDLSQIVSDMALAISHRGPDDAGVWSDEEQGIALGHRRLSVLDLSSAGHQPMHSANERYVMAFNGEIYNHLSIRAELEASGLAPTWRGHSDTETLLSSFSAWGVVPALQRTIGMFAIVLWDCTERRLILVRDRLGEKPLFYGWVQGAFVFGSELKALRAYPGFDNAINPNTLALFLAHNVISAPYSIYQDIFKLEPGCLLSLDNVSLASRSIHSEPYWRLSDVARAGLASPIKNESEALLSLDDTLRKAVALQTVADVPIGAFLSGGVDSTTIVAMMQTQSNRPVQTFTVGFDEAQFDESLHALAIAKHLGTDHHELRVTSDDAKRVIPLLSGMYDEPFADSSQIPTYLVSQTTQRNVTVALSGDGGDELFGGYNRYVLGPKMWDALAWIPRAFRYGLGMGMQQLPVAPLNALVHLLPKAYDVANFGHMVRKMGCRIKAVSNQDELYRSLVTEWPQAWQIVRGATYLPTILDDPELVADVLDAEHRMMLWDTVNYLPDDILTKVDRAAMSVSLETRVPFLDHRVVELAWRLPLHMKIRNGQGKWALRQVLYQYVPEKLIERPKMGFGIPVGQWLRGPLRDWGEILLDESRLMREGYLLPAPVRKMWDQHLSGRYDWTTRLWAVLMFQAWLEENT
jgi:asparagine synthase (glutamine-hydrolysing)